MHKFLYHFISFFIPMLFLSCASNYTHTIKSLNGNLPTPHQTTPSIQVAKTIYIDARFDANERRLIRDAALEWMMLSNQIVMYNLVYDYEVPAYDAIEGKIVVVHINADNPLVEKFEKYNYGSFQAEYERKDKAEFIFACPQRMTDIEFYQAMERVFGKELGLQYIYDVGIMNEVGSGNASCATRNDMLEFCRVFLCKIEEVRYCDVSGN